MQLFQQRYLLLTQRHRKHACETCGSKDHGSRTCKNTASGSALSSKLEFGVGGTVNVDRILVTTNNLTRFQSEFTCLPAPARPNTSMLFQLVDVSKEQLLSLSLLPFIANAWSQLLSHYPPGNSLRIHIVMLLRFACLLGYKYPDAWILSKNLPLALLDLEIIDNKLAHDLKLGRVVEVKNPTYLFISSPLGLVPKHDGGFRKIYHLSFPNGSSVNDCIAEEACLLSYISLHDIFHKILVAGRHAALIKRDVKDAFQNIPVAPHMQWLLGFQLEDLLLSGDLLAI